MKSRSTPPDHSASRRIFIKTVSGLALAAAAASAASVLPGCSLPGEDSGPSSSPNTGQKVSLTLANESSLATVGGFIRRAFGNNNGGNEVLVVRVASSGPDAFKT